MNALHGIAWSTRCAYEGDNKRKDPIVPLPRPVDVEQRVDYKYTKIQGYRISIHRIQS